MITYLLTGTFQKLNIPLSRPFLILLVYIVAAGGTVFLDDGNVLPAKLLSLYLLMDSILMYFTPETEFKLWKISVTPNPPRKHLMKAVGFYEWALATMVGLQAFYGMEASKASGWAMVSLAVGLLGIIVTGSLQAANVATNGSVSAWAVILLVFAQSILSQ
jgi:hypothetical protein